LAVLKKDFFEAADFLPGYECSHWSAISGDRWADDVRLSDLELLCVPGMRPGAALMSGPISIARQRLGARQVLACFRPHWPKLKWPILNLRVAKKKTAPAPGESWGLALEMCQPLSEPAQF
jgi:hypothetical protein